MHDYWLKQTTDKPLFPDLLWSRPENKRHAGKLLIIGGNSFGFSSVGEAYMVAADAGIGTARVLLPEAIRKVVGRVIEHAEFASSNPSGGFAQTALGEWLTQAVWADATLLAGDFGKNSETAIVLEAFLQKYDQPVTICGDALEIVDSRLLLDRENTLIVPTTAQLQKLVIAAGLTTALTSKIDFTKLIDIMHELTAKHPSMIVLAHETQTLVAMGGNVSSTPVNPNPTKAASTCAVWWLQNPGEPFKAATTALAAS